MGTTWIGGTLNRKLFENAADTKYDEYEELTNEEKDNIEKFKNKEINKYYTCYYCINTYRFTRTSRTCN